MMEPLYALGEPRPGSTGTWYRTSVDTFLHKGRLVDSFGYTLPFGLRTSVKAPDRWLSTSFLFGRNLKSIEKVMFRICTCFCTSATCTHTCHRTCCSPVFPLVVATHSIQIPCCIRESTASVHRIFYHTHFDTYSSSCHNPVCDPCTLRSTSESESCNHSGTSHPGCHKLEDKSLYCIRT